MMTQTSKSREADSCCTTDFGRLFPTELFRALSDANRIALLGHLATGCGPQTVTGASGCCPTDISVTSRHLAILRNAGIVEAQKQGREVYYSVRYEELSKALRAMADAIDTCCPQNETGQGTTKQPEEALSR
jgi:DNA-binding transcriptional ArsR family regulator